jgi:hypothetical protein
MALKMGVVVETVTHAHQREHHNRPYQQVGGRRVGFEPVTIKADALKIIEKVHSHKTGRKINR